MGWRHLAFVFIALSGGEISGKYSEGTRLASVAKKEAQAIVEPYQKPGKSLCSWEKAEEKTESYTWLLGKASYVERQRTAAIPTEIYSHDLVLQNMPGPEFSEVRHMQTVSPTLEFSMDGAKQEQEEIEEQKYLEQREGCRRAKANRRGGLADVCQQGSLGHIYTSLTTDCQKGGHSYECARQGGSISFAASSFSSDGINRGVCGRALDRSRDENAFPPQGIEEHEHHSDRGARFAAGGVGESRKRSSVQQGTQPWPFEQIQQSEKPSICTGEENFQFRFGMEQLRADNASEDRHACRHVSKVSGGSTGSLQSEAGGAQASESRTQVGITQSTGRAARRTGGFRANRYPRADGGHAGCAISSGPCGTCGQSSRGRRSGRFGYEGRWRGAICERDQIDREGTFQGGRLPAESGKFASKSQEGKGEAQRIMMDNEGDVHRFSWETSGVGPFDPYDLQWHDSEKPDKGRTGFYDSKELSHMTQVVTHLAKTWRETIDHIFHCGFSWVGWSNVNNLWIQDSAMAPQEAIGCGGPEFATKDVSWLSESSSLHRHHLDRNKDWEVWWNNPFTWTVGRSIDDRNVHHERQTREAKPYTNSILKKKRLKFEPHCINDGAFMSSSLNKCESIRKEVSFYDKVGIVCCQENQRQRVFIEIDRAHDFLRNFWHLHGQIACWKTIKSAFHKMIGGHENGLQNPGGRSEQFLPTEVLGPDGTVHTFGEIDLANLISTHVNDEQRAPRFIETWYLSRERYPLCVRPRRLRIESNMRLEDLHGKCRNIWSDICDGSSLYLVEVEGTPRGLPSSILHLLVMQGPIDNHNAVIFHSERFPVLFRQRAVMFPYESTVHTLFHAVQFPEICQHHRWSCYAKWQQHGQWQIKNGHEIVNAPFAHCLEGDARWDDSDQEEDGSEPDSDEISTVAPTDSVAEDGEEFSLMSGGPIMWPFEDLPGLQDHMEQEMEQTIVMTEEPNIVFAHHHMGHIQDHIDVIMEDLPQDQRNDRWAVVTFGIGLLDLGRRDTTFHPWRMHELLDAIYVLWEDHAQYGDLTVFNVHPQPMDLAGEKSIVVIVEVRMPESDNALTRNVLVHQRAVPGVAVRPSHYAAKIEDGSGIEEVLSQLNLHHLCPPFTLRECGIRMGMQSLQREQHYNFDHGLLCLVWIGSRPPEVERAILQVRGVETFFLQLKRLMEFQPERMTVSFTVHGISPAGRPLGYRMLHCDLADLRDLQWITIMQQLWPFFEQGMKIVFVEERTRNMQEFEDASFHFIVSYGADDGIPILIQQAICVVEEVPRQTNDVSEIWATRMPNTVASQSMPGITLDPPFWFRYARTQHVYPHLYLDDQHLREVTRVWIPGDVVIARFLVWQRHHALAILLREGYDDSTHEELEYTSLLQHNAHGQKREKSKKRYDNVFMELDQQWNVVGKESPFQEKVIETLPDDRNSKATLRCCEEDNSDLFKHQACSENEGQERRDEHLTGLRGMIDFILARGQEGINRDCTILSDFHPYAQIAWSWLDQGHHDGCKYHIFTDGSCKNEHATWAFVVIQENHMNGRSVFHRVGFAAGEVSEDVGPCDQTSLDAEATAIIAMIEYALALCTRSKVEMVCHFDARVVGRGIFGQQKIPKAQGSLSRRQKDARILMTIFERMIERIGGERQGVHVCAHQGHPWNELADGLAKAVGQGWKPDIPFIFRSGPLLCHPMAEWAWMEIWPTKELPDISTILRNDKPFIDKGIIDTTLTPPLVDDSKSREVTHIQLATVNVGTLLYDNEQGSGVSWKAVEIIKQFEERSIHIVGVQESRSARTHCVETGPFVRLIVAGTQGQAGVELWINGRELGKLFKTDFQSTKDVCVWHQNSRMILARCNFGNMAMDIGVLYAPQRGRPLEEIQKWWDDLELALRQRDRNVPFFCLGDFNCRIGSTPSDVAGSHASEIEDEGGARFRHLCEMHDLIIPSTFSDWHKGVTTTYTGPNGATSRIDYIAISQACQQGIEMSFVDQEIDIMNGERDHRPLVLKLTLQRHPGQSQRMTRMSLYNRKRARKEMASREHSLLSHLPAQDWLLDVNAHWGNLRQHMQIEVTRKFPNEKRKQRQLYISEKTWALVCQRKDLRQQHRELLRHIRHGILSQCFGAWKNKGIEEQAQKLKDYDMALLQQQEAMVVEARRNVDTMFRQHKKSDWKTWVENRLQEQIEQTNRASHSDLFHILQPKKMIAKHSGKLTKPMPGLRSGDGSWNFSRDQLADAWQRQFAKIENAEPKSIQDMLDESKPCNKKLETWHLQEMPTLLDVEQALRALADSKAAGLDGLGAELFQDDCAAAAKRVFPILLKMAVRRQSVVELSGGWLLPLFKGKGSAHDMKGYSAILLEPVIARALSKAWRPKLLIGLDHVAMPLQWGGRNGLSIEALHLQVQMWQTNARKLKHSHGIIFVDIRAAFYSVIKQMFHHDELQHDQMRKVFAKMGLPETVWDAFVTNVQEAKIVFQATSSEILAAGTQAMLAQTWFSIPDSCQLQAPMTGSRPGDPNADALFSLLMARILRQIHERALYEGIPLGLEKSSQGVATSDCVTWVDDVAFSVCSTADGIVKKVTHLVAIIQDIMIEHGMELTYGAGKTAVMFAFHGKGATRARQDFEKAQAGFLHVITEHQGMVKVPVVTHYKHLGGFISRTGAKLQEIRVRSACTLAKLYPLRKILKNKGLDVAKRQHVVHSMGLSVLTLHAGTWYNLNQSEMEAWRAGVFKAYQSLQARLEDGNVPHLRFYEIARDADSPMPVELMYIQRLRLLFQILGTQDKFMIGGILYNFQVAGHESWLHGAIVSVKWMRSQIGEFEVPSELDELSNLETWELFAPAARKLAKALRKVKAAHMHKVHNLCNLHNHDKRQSEILRDMGWSKKEANSTEMVQESRLSQCDECAEVFLNEASLAVHQQRRHGKRMAMRRFAGDAVCRACLRFFHTRPRLLRHLHMGTTDCWIWHCRKYVPMSTETAQELDLQDKNKGVAMHQKGFLDVGDEMLWRDCSADECRHVLEVRQEQEPDCSPPSQDELKEWAKIGLLPPGKGGRAITVRARSEMRIHHVSKDTVDLEQKLLGEIKDWEPCHDWVPRPLAVGTKYFLIMFSGHRRFADIAQWISWNSDVIPISIDLTIDDCLGNILKDDIWKRLIWARKVTGGHAGPPCETFSFARWLMLENGQGPQPLRTTEAPWGRDHLSLREVEQVVTGTKLMLQAIYLLMLIFIQGGSFSLEHPKGREGQEGRWSIWDSAFVKILLLAGNIWRVDFLQGPLGQPFAKPTSLLTGRLPDLPRHLFALYQPNWVPTERLGGKSQDGKSWKTSKAKAYPPRMCQALAFSHLRHAQAVSCEGSEEDPAGLDEVLRALAAGFDPYLEDARGTTMGHDYWGRKFWV